MRTIPLFGVVNTPEMEDAAVSVLRSGRIASGEFVERFESGFAALIGAKQESVVSTIDMTSAIFLALYLSGVRPGDEVLTTAFACMSTNAAIAQCGATPVWVDVLPRSMEVDINDAARAVTAKTKAAILYHVAGYPGPAQALAKLCAARGIALIEDCDNALLAECDGLQVGHCGNFAVYSFYPNRQINCTEGGALVCRDQDVALRARKLRKFGIDGGSFRNSIGEINPASDIPEVGWSFTMNNLCAALGSAQLSGVSLRVDRARRNAAMLTSALSGVVGLDIASTPANSSPAYWVLIAFVSRRDAVIRTMKSNGVNASSLHCRNDNYTGFRAQRAPLPHTGELQERVLALPCGWWLTDDDLERIAVVLRQALEH